jgi:hypothetical protein
MVVLIVFPRTCSKSTNNDTTTNYKIDSLETKIDSLNHVRDSTIIKIDTINNFIEKVRIEYEKDKHIIITNSTNEDMLFFSDYISRNKARLDSLYFNQ